LLSEASQLAEGVRHLADRLFDTLKGVPQYSPGPQQRAPGIRSDGESTLKGVGQERRPATVQINWTRHLMIVARR